MFFLWAKIDIILHLGVIFVQEYAFFCAENVHFIGLDDYNTHFCTSEVSHFVRKCITLQRQTKVNNSKNESEEHLSIYSIIAVAIPAVGTKEFNGVQQNHEAPMLWKLIGEQKWILMQDRYSMTPHNFYFCETTDLEHFKTLGYFDDGQSPLRRTNFSEQKHGAVVQVTKKELSQLIKYWNK